MPNGIRPGVAVDDLDVLEGYLQLVGRQLGEGGLVPLAVGVRAGEDRDLPGRGDANLRALPEAGLGAERARHRGGAGPQASMYVAKPIPRVACPVSRAASWSARNFR